MPRLSLANDLMSRKRILPIPSLAPRPSVPEAPAPFEGPVPPTRRQSLEQEVAEMNQPLTKKQGLLEAITAFAPTAIAGLFGGSDAAAGAAQGTSMALGQRNAARETRRKTLSEEIEAERGREFQGERDAADRGLQREKLSTDVDQFNQQMGWNRENANNQRNWLTGERLGTQDFTHGENENNHNFLNTQRVESQRFTGGENDKNRNLTQTESKLERDLRLSEGVANRGSQERINSANIGSREKVSFADLFARQQMNTADNDSRENIAGLKKGSFAQDANAGQQIDEALATIGQLKEGASDGVPFFRSQSGAVGFKGPLGSIVGPLAGSDTANYIAKFDALKSQLILPKLQLLRGLGAMSDREFSTLSSAATSLSRDMSEKEFNAELARIENGLRTAKARILTGSKAGPLQQGTTVGFDVNTTPARTFDFVPGKGLVPR